MNDNNVVIIYINSIPRSNLDMFGINSDRSVGISTLLGVARDDTMIIIYIFSLFLTFSYVSNFSAIRGF